MDQQDSAYWMVGWAFDTARGNDDDPPDRRGGEMMRVFMNAAGLVAAMLCTGLVPQTASAAQSAGRTAERPRMPVYVTAPIGLGTVDPAPFREHMSARIAASNFLVEESDDNRSIVLVVGSIGSVPNGRPGQLFYAFSVTRSSAYPGRNYFLRTVSGVADVTLDELAQRVVDDLKDTADAWVEMGAPSIEAIRAAR